jgi:putative tryptophan/tyrosine transport system substrate-binding protein
VSGIRRRDFILLGGVVAAAWPLAAHAQQPAMPVVGYLSPHLPGPSASLTGAFRQGLKDSGYVEGENVTIIYRWAEGQWDRLPALATELLHQQVAVIAAFGLSAAFAAKAATPAIPIVFSVGDDPVTLGLVASLAQPGGNVTGINNFATELVAKRLELLREMVPAATRVAVLVSPSNTVTSQSTVRETSAGARAMGLEVEVLNADTSREIDAAFATLARQRSDALLVDSTPFFLSRRAQLVNLASRLAVPAIYVDRAFAEIGGLMSYGASLTDAYRQVAVYTARILKGTKPADLPVVQSSKFELVINRQTARMLGLTVSDKLLATADEVIE